MIDTRYIRVATKFWQDEKVKNLSDDGKLLYLYVLTSPHSNMAGYYILPKPYVSYDLKWSMERLDKPFRELLEEGLIKYCEQSDVILIPNFLRYNPIQNKNQAIGMGRRIAELPKNALVKDFETVAERFAEPFMKQFEEQLPKRYTNTDTDTETETDTEAVSEKRETLEEKKNNDDDQNFNSEIIKTYAQTFGHPPNQIQLEMLTTFLDDGLPEELIIEALKRTAESGVNNPRYTTAILQSWLSKKALTLDDVKALDKLRHPTKRNDIKSADEFTYTEPKQDKSFFSFLDEED